MENPPLLSAIITVFNGERYLREAILSLLAQTFADFEVVIVNDGSTDGTVGIITECMSLDSRVRLRDLPHVGRADALNAGCREARGEFVAILDADDVALPERFERQAAYLRTHPSVALLGSGVIKISSDGKPFDTVTFPTDNAELTTRLLREGCFAHSTVVMSRDAVSRVGGYRSAFPPAEDYDLWLRLSEQYEIANLPEALVKYRVHFNQVSSSFVERHTLAVLAARVSARKRKETGVDLTDNLERITVAFLEENGVKRAEIHRAIVDAYLSNALTFWISGARDLAIDTLNSAVQWGRDAHCDPAALARIHNLLATRYMRTRRPLKALRALATSFKANPAETKALLLRILRRPRISAATIPPTSYS